MLETGLGTRLLLSLTLVLPVAALRAAEAPVVDATQGASRAFARYITGLEESSAWNSETVDIDASLPKLDKHGTLRAIRRIVPFSEPEYQVLEIAGDATVRRQVIARYISAERTAAAMSASAVAVTPANYEFHYKGLAKTGETTAYVFQIRPRKKREGLIKGELWLDGESGAAVRLSGYLVKNSSIFLKRVTLTRETELRDGIASARLTHLSVDTRLVGPAELTIEERPYTQTEDNSGAKTSR